MASLSGGGAGNATAPPSPEDADAATFGLQNIYIINTVLTTMSVLGGLTMIVPFAISSAWRTKVRHRLILGLGVSDLCNALCALIPSIANLAGAHLSEGSPSCVANVFFYNITVLTSSFWALAIAAATYCLLVLPLSPVTALFSRTFFFPFVLVSIWLVGIVVSSIGVGLYHSSVTDAGGFCFYADAGRLFGQLVLFIPRAIIFVIMIALYAKLFMFFRRKDSYAVCSDPNAQPGADLARYLSKTGENFGNPENGSGWDPAKEDSPTSPIRPITPGRTYSAERLLSDVKNVAASPLRRWSAPNTGRKMSKDSGRTLVEQSSDLRMQALTRSMGRRATAEQVDVEGVAGGEETRDSIPWETEVKWGISGDLAKRRAERRSGSEGGAEPAGGLRVMVTSPSTPPWVQGEWDEPSLPSPTRTSDHPPPLGPQEDETTVASSSIARSSMSVSEETERQQPTTARTSLADDEEGDVTLTQDPQYQFPPRPPSAGAPSSASPSSSRSGISASPTHANFTQPARLPSLEEIDTPPASPDVNNGGPVGIGKQRALSRPVLTAPIIPNDFLNPNGGPRSQSALAMARDFNLATPTPTAERRRSDLMAQFSAAAEAQQEGGGRKGSEPRTPGVAAGGGHSEGEWSGVSAEDAGLAGMSAQEMNRKASMLMLLYPAAYLVLFSVSLARIIVEFVAKAPADPVLKGLSKWLILSSGWVDATIFIFIEWSFRWSNRRWRRWHSSNGNHS